MRRPYRDENEYTFIENKARELGGYDDASLLREAAEAERALKNERAEHPEETEQIEQELDAGFERLKARIREKGIRPSGERRYRRREKKKRCFRCPLCRINKKTVILVIIVAVLAVGGVIAIAAKSRVPGYDIFVIRTERPNDL